MSDTVKAVQAGLTRQLAERAQAVRFEDMPSDVREMACHSILDFLGLAISSASHPLIGILVEEARELAGRQEASAVGSAVRLPAFWAATINSAAGHVLAYDDVNMVIPGHGTAVALPSALALAERQGADGPALLTAFLAGFETVCQLGAIVEPSHYDSGFHASATIGTFGAATAAGKVMGLDTTTLTQALSLSASMAAGLKGAFGTMVKPFQVARAAGNGVMAASLARRGLTGRGDMFEAVQGFAATHTSEAQPKVLPAHPVGHFMRATLFKYHAACYLAHSPMESAAALRLPGIAAVGDVAAVTVRVNPMCGKVCNIQEPGTGAEIGYSIRMLTAMALLGIGVTRAEDLTTDLFDNAALMTLRDKVRVTFDETLPDTASIVEITGHDGSSREALRDVGKPPGDLAEQSAKLHAKFRALAEPVLGEMQAGQLIELVSDLPRLRSIEPIVKLMRAPAAASIRPASHSGQR